MDNRGEDRKKFSGSRSFDRGRDEGREKGSFDSRRRFDRNDDRGNNRRGFRREDRKDTSRRPSRGNELGSIMDIDADILHLVVRRAQMLSRLRSGGHLAPEKEKALRIAWESKAARLARDNRLSRDLFVLLQSIEALTRAEEEQGFYNLAPSSEPVDIRLPAPTDTVAARCWLTLSAASGQKMKIERVPLTDAVISGIKALNQMGGQLWWEDNGEVQSRGGKGLIRNIDKVIHIGDDAFNLWLIIALCIGMPSRLKIMGESSLRFLDLAPLRHFLPQLGVRLTNVIPSQDGLPIRIECSGMVPSEVRIPDDIPEDFAAALVLASPFWEEKCRIVLPKKEPRLLSMVLSILTVSGAVVSFDGHEVTVERGQFSMPEEPVVAMDAVTAATLLMVPGFNGGKTVLEGVWGHSRAYALVEKMLEKAGLDVSYGKGEVVCSGKSRETSLLSAEDMTNIQEQCPDLLPLAVLIMAAAVKEGAKTRLPELSGENSHLVTAFLARCGVDEQDGELSDGGQEIPGSWVAPSAPWAMAYALAAFLRPNLHLSNPGILTGCFPSFWKIYNTLPCPELKRREEQESEDAKPSRRRVIAQGVYGELPPEPAPGDDF